MSDKSHLEVLFIIHYAEFDAESGEWTGVRIRKLCNLLRLTQAEFARYIRLTPGQLQVYISKGRFPKCIRLLLDLVERSASSAYLGTTPTKALFPHTPNG